ncbi:MAG: heat-inducible transcriptional repressor HrcA [Parachlamydiales bacterium]|jgi:heat-inducible transcriptional repressor
MSKKDRERQVLLGLVDFYIKTGKPVGSETLKGAGFDNLSSATIRNYFSCLEKDGFLKQQHSSGGRVPTSEAFRLYTLSSIDEYTSNGFPAISIPFDDSSISKDSTHAIASHLQKTAEILSGFSGCAVFLSAPKFDHDFISEIKLVSIDAERYLCVIISDFGIVQTEVLHSPRKLSSFSLKRLESYFQARISGQQPNVSFEPDEETIAKQFYNELMVRHLVSYTNFSSEYIYTTGFAQLLNSPEYHDIKIMAAGLSLFEDEQSLRHLIQHTCRHGKTSFWIGDDLKAIGAPEAPCSVIAMPYYIHNQVVGAVGVLGPLRMPYRDLLCTLNTSAEYLTHTLTRTVYKFKITFRQPKLGPLSLSGNEQKLIVGIPKMLIEDKSAAAKPAKRKPKLQGV